MLCVIVSIFFLFQTFYIYLREKGLLTFLPEPVQHLLTCVSFFDILVNVLIHRKFSKTVMAVVTPFFESKTPEEAKKKLKKQVPINVQKFLFRKVGDIYSVNVITGNHQQHAESCEVDDAASEN